MYRFLRNMRRNLIPGRRITRYFLYATGEIVLLVIGILIALQINNWNQKRQKNILFNNSLEQLYNTIKMDTESLMFGMEYTRDQIDLIDEVLKEPDQFSDQVLPGVLFYLDQNFDLESHNRETSFLISSLEYDPAASDQRELAKQLTAYSSFQSAFAVTPSFKLSALLERHEIPNPMFSFGFSEFENLTPPTPDFFNQNNTEKVRELITSEELRGILLSMRAQKIMAVDLYSDYFEDGKSILKMIKSYNPDVKLFHKDIGILGSALPEGWEKSVSMNLTNAEKSIWETEIFLSQGAVKFRARESWSTNWGGKTFPRGKTIYFGHNIEVTEAGRYYVILNLSENTYEFVKLGE